MDFHWEEKAMEAIDSTAAGDLQHAELLFGELLEQACERDLESVGQACDSALQRLDEADEESVHYEGVARTLKRIFEEVTGEYLPGVDEERVLNGKKEMMERDGIMPLSKARMNHPRD
ncbi:hypothetical protein [Halobellus sp. H-GB7]|jgi:hypothetical protein|uniref:hypothetical protein n=1 Tax=Halobellus sp. H-GB7 TaxID=3069756 RepID=UPI0027AE0087|nr:hypothetical protein [Halobellus sp. H-GB7]MDQ2054821.1 hypothetical protein [Halobellus sp. H-GB7]